MHRTQGDGHAMLIEPLRDLLVSPMLAAQRKDGFAVRFQFAARPALLLGFGLWLQIHVHFGVNNSVGRSREIRANAWHSPRPSSCAKGRCLTELLVLEMVFMAVCIVVITIKPLNRLGLPSSGSKRAGYVRKVLPRG